MKPNLQDYPKFYRWLTLPFTRKPHRVQVLQRTNRILTFAMPGIYGLVFCWLFLKKTSMGGIWPFIWIPASGFVLFSLFRPWDNEPLQELGQGLIEEIGASSTFQTEATTDRHT